MATRKAMLESRGWENFIELVFVNNQVSESNKNLLDRIKHFFEHNKELEPGKWVKIKEWKGKAVAEKEITDGIAAHH